MSGKQPFIIIEDQRLEKRSRKSPRPRRAPARKPGTDVPKICHSKILCLWQRINIR